MTASLLNADSFAHAWPDDPVDLVLTDPPWLFTEQNGQPPPYPGVPTPEILNLLMNRIRWKRLVMWCGAGHMSEVYAELVKRNYDMPVTVGAWDKGPRAFRQGYHWRSRMEFLLVFAKPSAPNMRSEALSNGYHYDPAALGEDMHSYKPVGWQRMMIRRWVPVGGLVIDPFMGLGSVGVACVEANRPFFGVEVDAKRYARAEAAIGRAQRSEGR